MLVEVELIDTDDAVVLAIRLCRIHANLRHPFIGDIFKIQLVCKRHSKRVSKQHTITGMATITSQVELTGNIGKVHVCRHGGVDGSFEFLHFLNDFFNIVMDTDCDDGRVLRIRQVIQTFAKANFQLVVAVYHETAVVLHGHDIACHVNGGSSRVCRNGATVFGNADSFLDTRQPGHQVNGFDRKLRCRIDSRGITVVHEAVAIVCLSTNSRFSTTVVLDGDRQVNRCGTHFGSIAFGTVGEGDHARMLAKHLDAGKAIETMLGNAGLNGRTGQVHVERDSEHINAINSGCRGLPGNRLQGVQVHMMVRLVFLDNEPVISGIERIGHRERDCITIGCRDIHA